MKSGLLLLLIAVAGCPADDGPSDVDGGPAAGLSVEWLSEPAPIAGQIDSEHTLDTATLHLRNVRVIGDAGTGDPRTLAPVVELGWATGTEPPALAFADAPTGLYSRLSFTLDRGAGDWAYELTGTVVLDDVPVPYTLRDRDPLDVSMTYEITLPPGAGARIPVRIELGDVVRALEFEEAPVIDGRRVIETGDAQAAAMRTELAKAFGVHDSDL